MKLIVFLVLLADLADYDLHAETQVVLSCAGNVEGLTRLKGGRGSSTVSFDSFPASEQF
jgi:hypothetical protein